MQARPEDLKTLLDLQQVDLELMQAERELAELPQRKRIGAVRIKRRALDAKDAQVARMKEKAEAGIAKVEAEDALLIERRQRAQALIDAAGSDYRSIELHSREINGFTKRRGTLDEELTRLTSELDRIDQVRSQIAEAARRLAAEEDELTASFREQSGVVSEHISALAAKRASIAQSLPPDLVDLYRAHAGQAGGVGVGRLVDDSCGVCRTPVAGGKLIELKAQAPLGVCPACKRLLAIGV